MIPAGSDAEDTDVPDTEPDVKKCSCLCHSGGFKGIIWKILRFFYRLFGINGTCDCGAKHY